MIITTAADQAETAIWDPDEITITVQGGTHPHDLIRELAALLADLGAPTTTSTGSGLACFCGDPITIPHEAYAAGPL
ncbi:hypothetical protein [Streptomyces sp. AM 2-1-1]|uniref:hypothetical protein n=1 Tax=Streptomyces sp. AM 2-1-1 TaxID=3028709 RepID=UPI0023B9A331|nr:hypothetical protein [Streptomyces sp. AM 2-1-1]WEH40749.1 hypothetical protein PZB77_15255 [Streptomyces sp. AM 2-1-1]